MEYFEEVNKKYTLKLRENIKELPEFISEFFRAIAENTSARTRVGYSYDLILFFKFLVGECRKFKDITVYDFQLEDLEKITASDIDTFLEYVTYYTKVNDDGTVSEYQNHERGKSRKLASVRRMLNYFYRKEKIASNPGTLIETPKIHDKPIVRLEPDEVVRLLNEVESGEKLTKRQQKWHEYTKIRDLSIVTLLLGTGIRVSECVGLNINDVDFEINGIKITRKGGNQAVIYFGDEVKNALETYLIQRGDIEPQEGNEDALFLSMQKKRISDRAIQKMVKKYSSVVTTFKKISPHKLRSTYGTALYRETGDIYLVADVLGHKDVNTTRKHYADMEDSRRRSAANAVKLRNE